MMGIVIVIIKKCFSTIRKGAVRFVRLITGTPLIGVIKHLHPRGAITVFSGSL